MLVSDIRHNNEVKMANNDVKTGLLPLYRLDGNPIVRFEAIVLAGDATAIGVGDPIIVTGSANSTEVLGRPVGSLPTVIRSTAGGGAASIYGVVTDVVMDNEASLTYRAASTQRVLGFVPADGQTVFEIQSNGIAALASVGANADIVFTGTPNVITGWSQAELNEASVSTSATLQLKILNVAPYADNTIGDNGKYQVLINTAAAAPATAGI